MGIKETITKAEARREILREELSLIEKGIKETTKNLTSHEKARTILQEAASLTQQYLAKHLSGITTKALAAVFDDPYEFKVEFVKKRNSTECLFYFTRGGKVYDPLSSCGYGAADVAAFALKVAYILLSDNRRVLICDEPFKQLDRSRIPYASELIKKISSDLNFQFITATHIQELLDKSDRVFNITLTKGESKSEQVS